MHFKKNNNPNEINDMIKDVAEDLVYIPVEKMKECYIEQITYALELESKTKKIEIDNNRILDDFVFICFFLGNDFLPHFVGMDIKRDGLTMIIQSYVYTFSKTNIYLLDKMKDCNINTIFLEIFLEELSKKEDEFILNHFGRNKNVYYNNYKKCQSQDACDIEMWNMDQLRDIKTDDVIKLGHGKTEEWKYRYYEHYFNTIEYTNEMIDHICEKYLEGLKWVSYYYFKECISWEWQYPYNHGPFIMDIYKYITKNKDYINDIKFPKTKPIKSFEQLLMVIPPQKKEVVPEKFRSIFEDLSSDILDYFPTRITLDYLNKDDYFHCLPILPQIDIMRIRKEILKKEHLYIDNIENKRDQTFEDIKL
jgi:5'-3' exonuclease